MPYRKLTRDEHFTVRGPKRILALDGGGLRGVVALGFLSKMESLLRERYGDSEEFRLAHYFDLIAGTSTGAIIAAALAKGLSVQEVSNHYMTIGKEVFRRGWFRQGIVRARYDENKLVASLKDVLGNKTRIGDPEVQTGLLVVTKRNDTGSPWPISNNPAGRYFTAKDEDAWISNSDYPLWKVVRASTAAPSFFNPEKLTIARKAGRKTMVGEFVDGGVSPFNNPSLQAFVYATVGGYRVGWKTGAEKILLVSVGTGTVDPSISASHLAAQGAVKSLLGLIDDCATLMETLMQWMSHSSTARKIDREIGTLEGDLLSGKPLLTYQRYNVSLDGADVLAIMPDLDRRTLKAIPKMDVPENIETFRKLGEIAAASQIKAEHFPSHFDLESEEGSGVTQRRKYRKRTDTLVVAVQLDLATKGFHYEKWGDQQTCKPGDWVVNNGGDVYTVDRETFERTYCEESPGSYRKVAPVWAELADHDGAISTKEGTTRYRAGDYLVFNDEDGKDGYAVSTASFSAMYAPAE